MEGVNKELSIPAIAGLLQDHLRRSAGPDYSYPHLLAHGEANLIFRLDPATLARVAISTPNQRFHHDPVQVTRFEREILLYLQGTGISHTLKEAQLQAEGDFPYTYLVTNYLEGESLNYSRDQLAKCAETLARLHRLPLDGYPIDRLGASLTPIHNPLTVFFHESLSYAQPYLDDSASDPTICAMIQDLLAKAEAQLTHEENLARNAHLCLVHSDHTFDNWVINAERAYLIDWEWAELSTPAGDLGHFLSPVTLARYPHHHLLDSDRAFFLQHYYDALQDPTLARKIQIHFQAFGAFPAIRSLCWTVGYWLTQRWYSDADHPSATARRQRYQQSQEQFATLWQATLQLLENPYELTRGNI
jgi:thiamine kinase-like enzyme